MPNTNFQTIHQMGGAINSFVKQATGRDAVQNIDMEPITVAQNHYYEDVDISGRVVSFNAGAAGIPLEKCLVQIEPVQDGTGDPSPDNVRPISGWTKAKVFVSPATDEADGTTYIIAFPSEAGTVYGGTLDVTTGELVVDSAMVYLGGLNWTKKADEIYSTTELIGQVKEPSTYAEIPDIICSQYVTASYNSLSTERKDDSITVIWSASGSHGEVWVRDSAFTDAETFKQAMADNSVQIVYALATPITYHLTPQEVRTLLGQNNVWADTGDIEVKFKNIKEFF